MNGEQQYIHYLAHMLDEAMGDKTLVTEDKEGKNINKAEKWIKDNHPEVIGLKLENGTVITPRVLTQEIRNTMPNVRMADCKFLVGATRLYFDNQDKMEEVLSIFSKLNKMFKIICTAHANEYDNNLNGLSFEQLELKFSGAVLKELDSDKDEINKLSLILKSDYKIVPIDSFEEAKKYEKYTSWCVTHYEKMYESYTKGGLGRFYFCLKLGFEKIEEVKGEGCPMDEYGKSMIAISVNDDGSLNTCTCRWNHDNGADDNMMDTKQISEFFGLNFYKTFVPYPPEKLLEKYKRDLIEPDECAKAMGWMKIKDQNDNCFYIYILNGKVEKFRIVTNIANNIFIKSGKFHSFLNGRVVEGCPSYVEGDFDCFRCDELTSLKGAPKKVEGKFECTECNSLTSLAGAPEEVSGDFRCTYCKNLTSLESSPVKVGGDFSCSRCKNLTSLKGAPMKINGNFCCLDCNSLTSLKGATEEVGGDFKCTYCKSLTSLKGAPKKVGGDFRCSGCRGLTSLVGAPVKIGGKFSNENTSISQEQKDAYLEFLKNPTPEHIDDTGHYMP